MAYIGFDLDETLANMSGPDIYTKYLDPIFIRDLTGKMPNNVLKAKMELAFDAFAACLLSKPNNADILRPNILTIFGRLAQLKDEGIVKGIAIYSNNGNISALRLAKRMIEIGLGRNDIFCDLIDWYHPLRRMVINVDLVGNIKAVDPGLAEKIEKSNMEIVPQQPGKAVKTIKTLKNIFISSQCGSNTISNISNLFFFDDLVHPNIKKYIGDNYFQVKPFYTIYKKSIMRECFLHALESQGLNTDQSYIDIFPMESMKAGENDFNSILRKINEIEDNNYMLNEHKSYYTPAFEDDTVAIMEFINSKIATMKGGRRRYRSRRNRNKTQRKRKNLKST